MYHTHTHTHTHTHPSQPSPAESLCIPLPRGSLAGPLKGVPGPCPSSAAQSPPQKADVRGLPSAHPPATAAGGL
jgi:hypothetical protein